MHLWKQILLDNVHARISRMGSGSHFTAVMIRDESLHAFQLVSAGGDPAGTQQRAGNVKRDSYGECSTKTFQRFVTETISLSLRESPTLPFFIHHEVRQDAVCIVVVSRTSFSSSSCDDELALCVRWQQFERIGIFDRVVKR